MNRRFIIAVLIFIFSYVTGFSLLVYYTYLVATTTIPFEELYQKGYFILTYIITICFIMFLFMCIYILFDFFKMNKLDKEFYKSIFKSKLFICTMGFLLFPLIYFVFRIITYKSEWDFPIHVYWLDHIFKMIYLVYHLLFYCVLVVKGYRYKK